MKKSNLLTLLTQALLALFVGFSGVACLITAFSLPVSVGPILLACGLFALIPALTTKIRHGGLILLATLVLAGYFFWKRHVDESLLALLEQLMYIYDMAYDWGIPSELQSAAGGDMTMAVTLIAAVCTLLAGLGLSGGFAFPVLLAQLLPVIPCFVVIDTVPAPWCLLLVLACLVLTLLSQNVRTIDPARGARVVAFALIPVLLCSWLLFYVNPKEKYEPTDPQEIVDRVLEMVDKLPYLAVQDGEILWDVNDLPSFTLPQQTMPSMQLGTVEITMPPMTLDPSIFDIFKGAVALGNAGPRNPSDDAVMQLQTNYTGTIYLRERGYDVYTGTAWETSGMPQSMYINPQYLDNMARAVQITTYWTYSSYFLPYYTRDEQQDLPDGRLPNDEELTDYTMLMVPLSGGWKGVWQTFHGVTVGQMQETQFLDLPQDTLEQAQQILTKIGIHPDMMVLEAVLRIQDYVKSSATYDQNTASMPEEYDDFAIWFLEESETGYCVHFATAATVLLRAAGIPARYVEGYMTTVRSKTTDVLASDAHAWVEYYLPEAGWLMLEATPGSNYTPIYPPDTEPPTETTEPVAPTETTQVPTMPTLPPLTEPTTVPVETTDPVLPTTLPVQTTTSEPTTQLPTTIEPTTVPETTVPEPQPPEDPELWRTLAWIFGLLAAACGIYGQWQLRLWLCRVWLSRGDTNRRAIKCWHRSRMYAMLRRQRVPTVLRDLAWKAKFSQHILTDEELDAFLAYHSRSMDHLKTRPWYLQLAYRLIFAAY